MASGVSVDDEVVIIYNNMKLKKPQDCDGQKKKLKAVFFCMSDDNKKIIVEKEKQLLVGTNDEPAESLFAEFIKMIPEKACRYMLYDFCYDTKETKKEELVFVAWAPDTCGVKDKMLYSSSREAIRKKFPGVKHVWQVNDIADLDYDCLAEKFGGDVVSLEGRRCGQGRGQEQMQQKHRKH